MVLCENYDYLIVLLLYLYVLVEMSTVFESHIISTPMSVCIVHTYKAYAKYKYVRTFN